jgi:hypothetical protein
VSGSPYDVPFGLGLLALCPVMLVVGIYLDVKRTKRRGGGFGQ